MDSSSPITDKYWADSPGHYDRNLNFVALANDIEEEEEYGCSKKKTARDPMSHRIIEKRRRDRMNNCLADLSRLLPAAYLKKGRGRIEKTEIIEMAIKHMRHLQIHACQQVETCEIASNIERQNNSTDQQYRLGYSECMSEMMHFLVEVEGFFAGDALCSRLMNHLQMHGEKISRGGSGFPHAGARSSSSSSGSSSADFHRNGTSSSGSSADNSQFMPRSSTSSSNCSSKSTKHQVSELDDKETRVKIEENESSASSNSYRLPSHMAGIDNEDMDRSSQCTTNPSSTAPSENNNQDSSDSGANMHQKDLKDMLLYDSGFTSTGTSHSSSSRLDEIGFYKKYKTDIQQRFTAEEHHGQEELDEPSDLESSKRRKVEYKASSTHEPSKYDFKAPTRSADTLAPPKEPRLAIRQKSPSHFVYQNGPKAPPLDNFLTASPATHSPQCETVSSMDANNLAPCSKPDNLPVFVLHPQGSFYIPTLIEASVVTPLLTEYVQAPVLHPVTIHVSFGHSAKVIGAKMEPHSFPSSTPVADPSVGSESSKGLLAIDRRGRLSPYEKRKSPHGLAAPSPAPLDASNNENTNNNNVRRWMEERVPVDTREYGSEDLRLPLNAEHEDNHRRAVEEASRSNAIFGSVGQSPRRGQATTGDIKELTAHSLLELSTQTSKDNYRHSRHSSAAENTNYSFPVQESNVPVHPFPSRDCEVLREVPSSNSARWSYLMGSAKRL